MALIRYYLVFEVNYFSHLIQSQLSVSETESADDLPNREYIELMRKHLHAQRKTFNGSTLVEFLKTNMHMFDLAGTNKT